MLPVVVEAAESVRLQSQPHRLQCRKLQQALVEQVLCAESTFQLQSSTAQSQHQCRMFH